MKKIVFLSVCGLSAWLLNGCTGIGIYIANAPTAFFNGTVHKDIRYYKGEHALHTMDIYVPARAEKESLPVIVFLHGGRWTTGKKEDYRFVGTALADQGFIVAIPDYRKYPEIKFPVFVEDSAVAVTYVRNNITDYNGKQDVLFLAGHSSGAHMASLLVSNPHYLGDTLASVKGFAGLAGPYDFVPKEDDLKDMFAPPSRYSRIQAPTFIDGTEPPMLLLHGKDDDLVGLFNLQHLRDAIQQHGGAVETVIYPDTGHVGIIGAFSWFLRFKTDTLKDTVGFFKKYAD